MKNIFRISGAILLILSIFLIHSCKKDKPTPPIITTTAVSAITQTTATSGGNITSDGGATVTARGVCWSTTTGPTTALSTKTIDGTGTGTFTSSITGLTAGTVYYIRAYATNSTGTAYRNEISFTTTASTVPVLTTTAASAITQTTTTSGGNVTSDGGATVTARGVCWSTSQNPTLVESKSTDGTGTGVFTSSITGLIQGTTYYVRAYAINIVGTSFGAQESFTTLGPPTVATATITAITQTTATGGGNVTAAGGTTVSARGICWSISQNPTITDSKTSDGTGTGSFTSALTALTGNTTYYVRAYATNSVSTSYGNQTSFKTSPVLPTITTTTVSSLTSTICNSGGTITNDGGATVTERGVCWSKTASPTILDSKTSNGTGSGTFTSAIAGLSAVTTYYVRAYATNSVGTAYGSEVTITTLGQVPTATAAAATSLSTTGATLNGSVNPNYLPTTVTFEYGTTISYGSTATATQSPVTGNTNSNISSVITGLLPGTTYHFRVKAINELGTTNGSDMTFTTLGQVPTATTQVATNITTTGATLNGLVNANDLSTNVIFEYGTTATFGSTATVTQSPVTGNTNTIVSANLTGLNPGTLYHFRVKSVNSLGTINGSDMTFTTLGQTPTATTVAASNILSSTATLNGIVNANYLSTTISFEWGTTISYGESFPATQSPLTESSSVNVSAGIIGLLPATTYHFRVKAENAIGITFGSDLIFTTLGQAPTAVSQPATNITKTSATLVGTVNPNYFSTTIAFEYGTTLSYGQTISSTQNPVTGNANTIITETISGLTNATTYHYRIIAVNSLGTTTGNDMILITHNADAITDIDNNYYNIVTIGTQTWLAENLKTTKYIDGTPIPNVTDNTTWDSETTGAFCYYNNNIDNNSTYGALYNYYSLVDSRKLCPIGWHVPNDAEWTTLSNFLGGSSVAGGKLKEIGITHWNSPNYKADNSSGFTGLPGGFRYYSTASYTSNFIDIGTFGNWWSSTEYNSTLANFFSVFYSDALMGRQSTDKKSGLSVRCIKD